MARVTTEAVLDDADRAAVLRPRAGFVVEDEVGPGEFTCRTGPFRSYRRTVDVGAEGQVRQTLDFRLAVPFFWFLFVLPVRRLLGSLRPTSRMPWWAPPDTMDARASTALGALCALSIVSGYLGTLLTQTITFSAEEFGVKPGGQSLALAAVRLDVLLAMAVVATADRRGRRTVLLWSSGLGCALTALGAASPSLLGLVGSQVFARSFVTSALVLIAVMAAEEMPAGGRAYALGLLTMSSALGAGTAVMLLPLADRGERAWRILFALGIVLLVLVRAAASHLEESRRYQATHATAGFAGHGRRFWLLAVSALLLAVFTVPASQFQNEYLRTERGFSGGRISLFTILTGTPGALGIVLGGRLAEVRGRRVVGAIAVAVGVGCTVAVFLSRGWSLWAYSVVGSIVGAASVPALGVYGPELFPTSLRGRANGVITGLARIGSVTGLLAVGYLASRFGSIGPAVSVLAVGPALLCLLVLVAYPETAHRELEELNPEDSPPPVEDRHT